MRTKFRELRKQLRNIETEHHMLMTAYIIDIYNGKDGEDMWKKISEIINQKQRVLDEMEDLICNEKN